ncbi:hypothetical protein Droror1_Dr00009887 [Drosera rotundifolia]
MAAATEARNQIPDELITEILLRLLSNPFSDSNLFPATFSPSSHPHPSTPPTTAAAVSTSSSHSSSTTETTRTPLSPWRSVLIRSISTAHLDTNKQADTFFIVRVHDHLIPSDVNAVRDVFALLVLGSWNGLLAFFGGDNSFYLWNPMTTVYKVFRADLQSYQLGRFGYAPNFLPRAFYGLSFDGNSDEYKMVYVGTYQSPPASPTRFDQELTGWEAIFVYTLSFKTMEWKEHWGGFPYRFFNLGPAAMVNGVPHWFVRYYDWKRSTKAPKADR